jgi:hypothetical protein
VWWADLRLRWAWGGWRRGSTLPTVRQHELTRTGDLSRAGWEALAEAAARPVGAVAFGPNRTTVTARTRADAEAVLSQVVAGGWQ